jgi:putative ABC transport system permease protein
MSETPRRWYRLMLYAYPRAFRERFGHDLEELFVDVYRARAEQLTRPAWAVFWMRTVAATVGHGLTERLPGRRRLPLRVHHARGPSLMTMLLENLRHASRAFRQQRALTLVILFTLALAIGANTAIFTVVNAVLLRPLPYTDPERVVMLYMVDRNGRDQLLSIPDYEDLRTRLKTITTLSMMGTQTANLTGVAEPDRLRAGFVTADFFETLGVRPIIGRGFADGEDAPGAAKTALLDHRVWQTRFGGDPAIIGRALVLNNEPHEVIGILPPSFEFPIAENEVWLPYSSLPAVDRARTSRNSYVFGRVADHVPFDEADAELRQMAAALAQAYPESNRHWSMRFEDIHSLGVMFVETNLRLLMGAVAFVLLIACANIANLLLARASTRQREIAVRAALGASRARIAGQLLLESLLLAVGGGVLGLLLSAAFTDGMLALLPMLPRSTFVRPDGTVLLFTALVSVATGVAFGLAPALRLSRPDLRSTLNDGVRGGEATRASRVRSALVVAELALSLMLVTGAGLFIQSLTRLVNVDLGFNPSNILTLEYRLPRNKYAAPEQQGAFHQRVIERVQTVPGVQRVAFARAIPQSGNGAIVGYWRDGDTPPSRETMPRAQYNVVSTDYFAVFDIPVLEGRTCGAAESAAAPLAVIVNQLLAERLWPGEAAVGRRLRPAEAPTAAVVIGVVGNTRPGLLSQPNAPQIYGCLSQQPGIFASLAIKSATDPLALTRSVQQAVWSVDPDQPMWKIRTAESLVSGSVQRDRFVMLLMSFAAGLALLLAGLGTYSVLSFSVQRRTREVGVRMALGATRVSIVRMVLAQMAWLTVIGVIVGLAGTVGLSRLVANQLYEISPRDPLTFSATAGVLIAVAVIAAWLPVRRAASVDPVLALRRE